MPNNLHVTLDKSTSPWRLDIDQNNGANQVDRSPLAQTITWQLTGNAASGSFDSLNWVEQPGAGIFGPPTLGANGNQITMSDLNNDPATAGTWTYQLSATIDGTTYESDVASVTGTTTSPWIKNN